MHKEKDKEVELGLSYEDRVSNNLLLPIFRKRFGPLVAITKEGDYDNFDRKVLFNWQTIGHVEIKRRYFSMDTYPTTIIPYRKYKEAEEDGTRDYWLVIGWDDAVGMLKMNSVKPVAIRNVERGDRNDGEKPHVEYSIKDFTIIGRTSMSNVPQCPDHGPMKPRKGKFGAFWSCGTKDEQGNWCPYKPPQDTPPPGADQVEGQKQAAKDKDENIRWMNALNNATALTVALYEKGDIKKDDLVESVRRAAIEINGLEKPGLDATPDNPEGVPF